MSALKILVCGDAEGNFKTIFQRVGVFNEKKGPFEYLFCIGNFFSDANEEWEDVLSGKISVPLTTYILGPNKLEHVKYYTKQGQKIVQLTDNVLYLGKRGIFRTASGINIAYLSGVEQQTNSDHLFDKKCIEEFLNQAAELPIDILLTSQWPKDVTNHAKQLETLNMEDTSSKLIAYVAKTLKPRYHFSGLRGLYYERLPYRNHQVLIEKPFPPTRFIGLASVNNVNKFKWIYAFNIEPRCSMSHKELIDVPGPVTECPYNAEIDTDQFFFATDMVGSSAKNNSKNKSKAFEERKSRSEMKCWFCLRNPDVEKHLLISIGEHSYITLAKGGIVKDHLLIISMEHLSSFANLPELTEKEVNRYKEVIVNYFDVIGKDVIFFERNFKSSHFQIQVVPVPRSISHRCKDGIVKFGITMELEFIELSHHTLIKQVVPAKSQYCYFEIVIDKKIHDKLIHLIKKDFPLQFGRMVLASKDILNKPDSIDWKKCDLPPEVEHCMVETLRKKFASYDHLSS